MKEEEKGVKMKEEEKGVAIAAMVYRT